MSDDLVARLNVVLATLEHGGLLMIAQDDCRWIREAATEIERLRAAVVTAKREALEEAVQIVQRMDVAGLSIADMIRQRSRAIAAILALQEPK